MADQLNTTMCELDSRLSDGILVRLMYCRRAERAAVAVTDRRTGESFNVEVRDDERALDVFHHPYAYAGWHGVETSPPMEMPQSRDLLAA
ncbi:MAG: hypothetical protein WBP81_22545 [Solirubrobacteraceae bacterium]